MLKICLHSTLLAKILIILFIVFYNTNENILCCSSPLLTQQIITPPFMLVLILFKFKDVSSVLMHGHTMYCQFITLSLQHIDSIMSHQSILIWYEKSIFCIQSIHQNNSCGLWIMVYMKSNWCVSDVFVTLLVCHHLFCFIKFVIRSHCVNSFWMHDL